MNVTFFLLKTPGEAPALRALQPPGTRVVCERAGFWAVFRSVWASARALYWTEADSLLVKQLFLLPELMGSFP